MAKVIKNQQTEIHFSDFYYFTPILYGYEKRMCLHFDTPSSLIIFLASRHTRGHTQCGGDSGENAHEELNHHLPSLFVLHSHKGFSVLHLVL